jgi:hypothetical protein
MSKVRVGKERGCWVPVWRVINIYERKQEGRINEWEAKYVMIAHVSRAPLEQHVYSD